MNITFKVPETSTAEISHGQDEFKFGFINKKAETLSTFFKCKDFTNDFFWSYYCKKPAGIYGFRADSKDYKDVLDSGRFYVAVKKQNRNTHVIHDLTEDDVKNIGSLVNLIGSAIGMKKTKLQLSDDKKFIFVDADMAWSKIPYIQSTFFLLLRMGITYDPKQDFLTQYEGGKASKYISPNDVMYFKQVKHTLKKLLDGEVDKTQEWKESDGISTVHNNYGIVSYSTSHKS